MNENEYRATFGITPGSFQKIVGDLRRLVKGGARVRASLAGYDGRAVLRVCDQVTVEARTHKDVLAMVATIKDAIAKATKKETGVVDLAALGVPVTDYQKVSTWLIQRLRALTQKCSSYVKVTVVSQTGFVEVVSSGTNALVGLAQAKAFIESDIRKYMRRYEEEEEEKEEVVSSQWEHIQSEDESEEQSDEEEGDVVGVVDKPIKCECNEWGCAVCSAYKTE